MGEMLPVLPAQVGGHHLRPTVGNANSRRPQSKLSENCSPFFGEEEESNKSGKPGVQFTSLYLAS